MRLRSGYLLMAGMLVFCILMGCGMGVYSGGTVMDPKAPHFLFWQNFLSDLGRTETFAGLANDASRSFFVAALLLLSTSLGIFLHDLQQSLGLKRSFVFACWITVFARFGVALTPWDRLGYLHLFLVQLTFLSGLRIGFGLLREESLASFRLPLRIWVGFQLIYLMLLFFGPFLNITSQSMLLVAAGSQKVLLLTEFWVWVGLGWRWEKMRPGRTGAVKT